MKKQFGWLLYISILSIPIILSGCSHQEDAIADTQTSAISIQEEIDDETPEEIQTENSNAQVVSEDSLTEELYWDDIVIEEFNNETILEENSDIFQGDTYEILVIFDEESHIQRTSWNFGEYAHALWYEIPIFPQNGIGYNNINGYFDSLLQEFIQYQDTEYSGLTSILAQITNPIYNDTYFDTTSTQIFLDTDTCVGVEMRYEWYMGGVSDYGSNQYYFDTQTGEPLSILDFIVNSENELKEMLFCELEKITEESDEIFWDVVENYPVDELNFKMYDENLMITFDKYEIAPGVMGGIGVTLPVTFNKTYGQELVNMED